MIKNMVQLKGYINRLRIYTHKLNKDRVHTYMKYDEGSITLGNKTFEARQATLEANVGKKTMTQNGTYYASTDNLDGYNEVTVNVEGGGGGGGLKLQQLCDGNIRSITAEELGDITELRAYAFYECFHLYKIELPSTIRRIQNGCFEYVGRAYAEDGEYVRKIILPPLLTTIGTDAFRYSKITSIEIPENVTTIYSGCFKSCTKLDEVIFRGTTPPNSDFLVAGHLTDAFDKLNSNMLIYVPAGAIDAYKAAFVNDNWYVSRLRPIQE